MNRGDFLKLIGAGVGEAEYIPVACLLRDGRGCAGYYNALINEGLADTCVLVNARVVQFRERSANEAHATITDFNEFLEEIVQAYCSSADDAIPTSPDAYGRAIPLSAIPFDQIAVLYPVTRIGDLMRRAGHEKSGTPSFLDFENKSVVLKLLRTKLW